MNPAVDPLAQLRDIHEPAALGWWPPAPGWWLLAALALLMLCVLLRQGLKRWRAAAYRRRARQEIQRLFAGWLEDGDHLTFLQQLNTVLKRTALAAFPRADIASLSGEQWCVFLDERVPPGDQGFCGSALAAIYRPDVEASAADIEHLQVLALRWASRHRNAS